MEQGGVGGVRRRDIFANKPREARQGRREICNLGASGGESVAATHSSRVESRRVKRKTTFNKMMIKVVGTYNKTAASLLSNRTIFVDRN